MSIDPNKAHFTFEAITASRRRKAEIDAEIQRIYGEELRAARKLESRARLRALYIIVQGAAITGYPKGYNWNLHEITIKASLVVAKIWTYDGEGNGGLDRILKFPTEWLSMPDEEWRAALAAEHAAGLERVAARLAREAAERAAQKEDAERALLATLKAKYPNEVTP